MITKWPFRVPNLIAVKIPCQDYGAFAEPLRVRQQCLVHLPNILICRPVAHPASPDSNECERHRARAYPDWHDPSLFWYLNCFNAPATSAEYSHALCTIGTKPECLVPKKPKCYCGLLRTFRDNCQVGIERTKCVHLLVKRHLAVPRDDSHHRPHCIPDF